MYTLIVENEKGKKLQLSQNRNYTITQIEGLNPVKASINTSVVGLTDGEVFNSSRAECRNIVITAYIEGAIEKNRQTLYTYFTPKKWVKLYFENENRDVYIEGYVESFDVDLFVARENVQISILCPKPYFKNVDMITSEFSSIAGGFQFTLELPEDGIPFSIYEQEVRKTIYYEGGENTGLTIRFTALGTVKNPVIYNADTKGFFRVLFTMVAGDVITIETSQGEKSVTLLRDGKESNIIGCIDKGVEWFELSTGDNVFTSGAEEGYQLLQIRIQNNVLYGGV